MTALAQGASASVSVGDGGYVTIATNGGFGSATITPTVGAASSVSFGPWADRRKLGPFSEGASVTLVNTSCGAFDYDYAAGDGGLTALQTAATQALVSADGNQPSATLAATVGTPGQVVKISDGADKGVSLVWAIPSGASAYAWCWQIYPQAAY